jgi:hypothetical protein
MHFSVQAMNSTWIISQITRQHPGRLSSKQDRHVRRSTERKEDVDFGNDVLKEVRLAPTVFRT